MSIGFAIKILLIMGVFASLGMLINTIYAETNNNDTSTIVNNQATTTATTTVPIALAIVPGIVNVGDVIITQILGEEGDLIEVSINNNHLSLDQGCISINQSVTKRTDSLVSIAACSVGTTVIAIPGQTYSVEIRERLSPTPTNIPAPTDTPVPTHTPAPTHTPSPTDIKPPTNVAIASTTSSVTITWDYESNPFPIIENFEIQSLVPQHGWGTVMIKSSSSPKNHTIQKDVYGLDPETRSFFRIRANGERKSSVWAGVGLDGDDFIGLQGGGGSSDGGTVTQAPIPYNIRLGQTISHCSPIQWNVDQNSKYFEDVQGYELQILDFSIGWVPLWYAHGRTTLIYSDADAVKRDGFVRIRSIVSNGASVWGYGECRTHDQTDYGTVIPNPYDVKTSNPLNSSLNITWKIDSNYPNILNLRYEIQISDNNQWVPLANVASSPYSATDLLQGTTYYFRIRSISGLGVSDWIGTSGTTSGTPLNILAEIPVPLPQNVMWQTKQLIPLTSFQDSVSESIYGSPDSSLEIDEIKLAWTVPTVAPHSEILHYEVSEYVESINLRVIVWRGDVLNNTINNLKPNEIYTYAVRTVTNQGYSEWSNLVVQTHQSVGTPTPTHTPVPSIILPPENFRVSTSTVSTITLLWDAPSPLPPGFSGYKIERYDLVYAPEVSIFVPQWVAVEYPGSSAMSATDTELESDTRYRYRIHARTTQGNSEWIETSGTTTESPITDEALPPTSFRASNISTSTLTLSWDKPSKTISTFLFYEIEEFAVEVDEWITINRIGDQDTENIDVENLYPGTEYWFRIRTVTDESNSVWVSTRAVTLPLSSPDPSYSDPPSLVFDRVQAPLGIDASQIIYLENTTSQVSWTMPARLPGYSQITGYNIYIYSYSVRDFININNSIVSQTMQCMDLLGRCSVIIDPINIELAKINLFAVEHVDAALNTSHRVATSLFISGSVLSDDILSPTDFTATASSSESTTDNIVILSWNEPNIMYLETSDIINYNIYMIDNISNDSDIFIPVDNYIYTDVTKLSDARDYRSKCTSAGCSVYVISDILESGNLYVFAIESINAHGVTSRRVFTSVRVVGKKNNAIVYEPSDIIAYDVRDFNRLDEPTATSTQPWIRLEWKHPIYSLSADVANIEQYNIFLVERDVSTNYTPVGTHGINSNGFSNSTSTEEFIRSNFAEHGVTAIYRNVIHVDNDNNEIDNVCNMLGCGIIVGGHRFENASFYTFAIESVDIYGRKSIDKAITSVRTHGERHDFVVPPPLNVRAFGFTEQDNDHYETSQVDTEQEFQRIYLSWNEPQNSDFLGIADVINYNVYVLEHTGVQSPIDVYKITRNTTRPPIYPNIESTDQNILFAPITNKYDKCHSMIDFMDFASSTNPQLLPDNLKNNIQNNNCHVAIVDEYFIEGATYRIFIASVDSNGRESTRVSVEVQAGGNALKPDGLPVVKPVDFTGVDISTTTESIIASQALLRWTKPIEQYNEAVTEEYRIYLVDFESSLNGDATYKRIPYASITAVTAVDVIGSVGSDSEINIPDDGAIDLGVTGFNMPNEGVTGQAAITPAIKGLVFEGIVLHPEPFTIDEFVYDIGFKVICVENSNDNTAPDECFSVVGNNLLENGETYTFAVRSVDRYGNLSDPAFTNVQIGNLRVKPIGAPLQPPLSFQLKDIRYPPPDSSLDSSIPIQYWIELSWIEPEDVWYYGTVVGYEIQYSAYFEEAEFVSEWSDITDDIFKFNNATTTIIATSDKSIRDILVTGILPNPDEPVPSIPELLQQELCSNNSCRGGFGNGVLSTQTRYFFRIRSTDIDGNYSKWVDGDIVLSGDTPFPSIHDNIKPPTIFRGYDDADYAEQLEASLAADETRVNIVIASSSDEAIVGENWAILTWHEPAPDDDTEDVERYEVSQFSNSVAYDPIEYYEILFDTSTSTDTSVMSYRRLSTRNISDICSGFGPMRENTGVLSHEKTYNDRWTIQSYNPTPIAKPSQSFYENRYEFSVPNNDNVTIHVIIPDTIGRTSGISLRLEGMSDEITGDDTANTQITGDGRANTQTIEKKYRLVSGDTYVLYVWTDMLPLPIASIGYELTLTPENPTVGQGFVNEYSGEISTCAVAVGNGAFLSGETYRFALQSVNQNNKSEPPETTSVIIAGDKIPPPDGVVDAELYPEPNRIVEESSPDEYILSASYYAWPIRVQTDRDSPIRIHINESLDSQCNSEVTTEKYNRQQVVARPKNDEGIVKVCLYAIESDIDDARLFLYRDTDNSMLEKYNLTVHESDGNGVFTFEPVLDHYKMGENYPTTLTFLQYGTHTANIIPDPVNENIRISGSIENECVDTNIGYDKTTSPTLMPNLATTTVLCILVASSTSEFINEITVRATTTLASIATGAIEKYNIFITEPQRVFQRGVCDVNADGILSDNELDHDNDGMITELDYMACGFGDEDERYKIDCTDRLCLNVALESMCNTAGFNCNGELLRIFVVLATAFGLAAMPLASTAVILSRFTVPAMVFSYLLFNLTLWLGVWLAAFPEYWALMPILLTLIFGLFFTIRKIQNR